MRRNTARHFAQIVLNANWKKDRFNVEATNPTTACEVQRALEHYGCVVARKDQQLVVSVASTDEAQSAF